MLGGCAGGGVPSFAHSSCVLVGAVGNAVPGIALGGFLSFDIDAPLLDIAVVEPKTRFARLRTLSHFSDLIA